jgi:hypothetical protein
VRCLRSMRTTDRPEPETHAGAFAKLT